MEDVQFIGTFSNFPEQNVPPIYLITSLEGDSCPSRKRCWGWYSTEEAAREAVRRNAADMYETIYVYVVIEKVFSGVIPEISVVQWFKWSEDPESASPYGFFGWKECPAPKWSEGIEGWGIG
jgi:hypothetical protein